jgi:hypothetical protein
VKGEKKERWILLCEQAAIEQDPKRLLRLVEEIDRLLQEKHERLLKDQPSEAQDAAQRLV